MRDASAIFSARLPFHFFAMLTRHIVITGRVQGVGFRDALCQEARRLGLSGWVRNLRDGSVEAVLIGSPGPVEELLAWAGKGPPLARVAEVKVLPESRAALSGPGFVRLPTA